MNEVELEKLFVSYLLNELNEKDRGYVDRIIRNDNTVMQSYEEFERIWKLLTIEKQTDTIDVAAEFEKFKERYRSSGNQEGEQPAEESDPAEGGWLRKMYFLHKRKIAIAASVMIIGGAGWWLLGGNRDEESVVKIPVVQSGVVYAARTEKNIATQVRDLVIQDGSKISLWTKSEVVFTEPFPDNKRVVNLSGKAEFKIAKDHTKPFTVYSGSIATTALGTDFVVTNYEEAATIIVRLIEGKVVVKGTPNNSGAIMKESVFLSPGDELIYNKKTGVAVVRNFNKETIKQIAVLNQTRTETNAAEDNQPVDVLSLPKNEKGSWYMFNNQTLSDIFDQLALMFNTDIVYNRSDISRLYFIGKFDKSDSLEYILKNIATINKLSVTKDKNRFIIKK